jgi:hypothetical protein
MISPFSDCFISSNEVFPETTIQQELFSPEFRIPACYINEKSPKLRAASVKIFSDKVLFFIFYNLHHERS